MAQEITTYDEVSTIDKNTKLLLTKDGGLGQKSIEEVGNVINGTGDISGIGDGTVKGAIRGLNDEMTVNLLHSTLKEKAQNGVTYTNNGDGTYTLNGKAADHTYLALYSGYNDLKDGTYKLLGKYLCIYLREKNDGTSYESGNDGGTITITSKCKYYSVYFRVPKDEVINNVKISPMITSNLKATYDDFVPYTGNTGHINSDLAALLKRVETLEAKG